MRKERMAEELGLGALEAQEEEDGADEVVLHGQEGKKGL